MLKQIQELAGVDPGLRMLEQVVKPSPVSHAIEKKRDSSEGTYFSLAFTRFKHDRFADERRCFYIRETDWTLFKWAIYGGDKLILANVIWDWQTNQDLSDELFDVIGTS